MDSTSNLMMVNKQQKQCSLIISFGYILSYLFNIYLWINYVHSVRAITIFSNNDTNNNINNITNNKTLNSNTIYIRPLNCSNIFNSKRFCDLIYFDFNNLSSYKNFQNYQLNNIQYNNNNKFQYYLTPSLFLQKSTHQISDQFNRRQRHEYKSQSYLPTTNNILYYKKHHIKSSIQPFLFHTTKFFNNKNKKIQFQQNIAIDKSKINSNNLSQYKLEKTQSNQMILINKIEGLSTLKNKKLNKEKNLHEKTQFVSHLEFTQNKNKNNNNNKAKIILHPLHLITTIKTKSNNSECFKCLKNKIKTNLNQNNKNVIELKSKIYKRNTNYGPKSIINNNNVTENIHEIENKNVTTDFYISDKNTIKKNILPTKSTNHFRVNSVFERARNVHYELNKTNKNINQLINYERTKIGRVSLLGLFELSTRWGVRPEGHSELAAAQMAVKHINKRGLLPGYTLELLTNDTECDPGVGVDRFFHALYTQYSTRMIMLLGSACSEVTESLAKVVPYWNIVQVSFGSTSPALSDRREFPLFYRTVAPDSSHNPARIAFIRRFGWDTVTTFSQNEEIHSLAVNDLVTELESANISCAATLTFAETDFKEQLKVLRDLDTRIIIGSFSHDVAPKIFCEAFKLGMFGSDYVWILQETLGPSWWWHSTGECSQKHLQAAVESLIIVSSHNSIVGSAVSYSGLTNTMFVDELVSLNVPQPISRYAPQTYDAVWAIALSLRNAEERWRRSELNLSKLDGFDYTRNDMALEFLTQFSKLNFLGVSGPVSFSGADRIGTSAFYQVQSGHLRAISLYYPAEQHLDFACPGCLPVMWQGGQVPIAKRIFKLRVATIAPTAFYTITSLASVGITISIGFLAFNLHFRKLKAIKLSSPKLSNITAVGCILVYAAVVLLGLDYSTLPQTETAFSTVCTARVYLLSAGYSLAFGSMFAKTYRVHRIFTHSGGGVCKDKLLQDTQLISLVCGLLLLDCLAVTLWMITDPMERHLNNLTLEISSIDRSVVYQPQVEVCRSQYTQSWLGAIYAYKGLLLIVGVYMAWETRHVKIPALNDSQYIGVSVYSVVITSAIVVVLANLISERVTLAYLTITVLILASTTATLCLLFLPKINDIWGKDDTTDPVIHSMGLKMECNTRRFVTDDRRELQYRVEVQNRVYKKEMAKLDAEILKLEKLLEGRSSTSSSSVSLPQHLRPEVTIINEFGTPDKNNQKHRTPSISGGLPLLLLSVLPPVIPRASWPSAEHMQIPMRRSVTFSSQPHLDDGGSVSIRLPAIDLLNLRLTHQQATENRTGFLDRIRGLFGSRTPSRKPSTASISGGTSGIAAALKAHMGLLTGLVPSTGTSSCHALNTMSSNPNTLRKKSIARSGTALNSSNLEVIEPYIFTNRNRKFSTAFTISGNLKSEINNQYIEIESEPRVNFQLPAQRRPSICHQNSQPTLRERVKGSPRFPHRIVPTSSLNALEDNKQGSTLNLDNITGRRSSQQQSKIKWKSMEESTLSQPSTSTISSNINKISLLPQNSLAIDQINICSSEIINNIISNPNHNSEQSCSSAPIESIE